MLDAQRLNLSGQMRSPLGRASIAPAIIATAKTTSSSKRSKSIIRPPVDVFPDIYIGSLVQKLATMRAMSFFVSKPTCRKADNKGCSNAFSKKVMQKQMINPMARLLRECGQTL
jgi:hypothetical protein